MGRDHTGARAAVKASLRAPPDETGNARCARPGATRTPVVPKPSSSAPSRRVSSTRAPDSRQRASVAVAGVGLGDTAGGDCQSRRALASIHSGARCERTRLPAHDHRIARERAGRQRAHQRAFGRRVEISGLARRRVAPTDTRRTQYRRPGPAAQVSKRTPSQSKRESRQRRDRQATLPASRRPRGCARPRVRLANKAAPCARSALSVGSTSRSMRSRPSAVERRQDQSPRGASPAYSSCRPCRTATRVNAR